MGSTSYCVCTNFSYLKKWNIVVQNVYSSSPGHWFMSEFNFYFSETVGSEKRNNWLCRVRLYDNENIYQSGNPKVRSQNSV